MVIPGWVEEAMGAIVASPEHQRDMAELEEIGLFPTAMVWAPSQVVESWEARDPLRGVVVRRIHERGVAAMERAGGDYQRAFNAWRTRVSR